MTFSLRKDGRTLCALAFASLLMALNIRTFVSAGGLYPGGVSGLTILLQRLAEKFLSAHLPYTPVNILLNAAPVYIGFRYIGRKFTLYSLLVIFLTGLFADLLPTWPPTYDPLLISLFGGMANGFAVSLCLRADATTGGTDFIAIYLSEKKGRDTWNLVLGINAAMLLVAGLFFGWDKALYSIIFQFATTEVVHVMYRAYQLQTLLIVTTRPDEICEAIHEACHHGATVLEGIGYFGKARKSIVYSVVASPDTSRIYALAKQIDPSAFINTLNTSRVIGRFYLKPRD